MLNINEIKKDLYKSKNMAYFSHYQSGDLYYNVVVMDALYQFPISVMDTVSFNELTKNSGYSIINGHVEHIDNIVTTKPEVETLDVDKLDDFEEMSFIKLSEDLGSTPFEADMRGSELIRWMQMAIKKEQFIKVG